MENCLVTKYKVDTNNNNLPFLDWYKVYFKSVNNPTNKTQGLRGVATTASPAKLKVLGNLYFTDSTLTQNLGTEITNYGASEFYVSNGNGVLLIPKSTIQIASVAGAASDDKAYYIKLDEFVDCETLTTVAVKKSESEGNFISLAKNINIGTISVSNCPNVTGEVIDFIIKQIDIYGRTSGILLIEASNTAVTIEDAPVSFSITINFVSASEFNFVVNDVTTTYNKINGVWTKQA